VPRPWTDQAALSLGGLRRRVEALLLPDDVDVRLMLDARAEQERERRRRMLAGAGITPHPARR
jgi:hypothetical protein